MAVSQKASVIWLILGDKSSEPWQRPEALFSLQIVDYGNPVPMPGVELQHAFVCTLHSELVSRRQRRIERSEILDSRTRISLSLYPGYEIARARRRIDTQPSAMARSAAAMRSPNLA